MKVEKPVPEYRIGQIWKDRRNKPESWIFITELYERRYADGNTATRVKYLCPSNTEDNGAYAEYEDVAKVGESEMDSRSIAKMYPCLLFDPPYPYPDPDGGK